jgi:hypothetical protein
MKWNEVISKRRLSGFDKIMIILCAAYILPLRVEPGDKIKNRGKE